MERGNGGEVCRLSLGPIALPSRSGTHIGLHRSGDGACDRGSKTSGSGAGETLFRLGLFLLAFALPACKSYSPSQYVSPRVEGRVLDAQSHQPVADVQVRPLMTDERYRLQEPPKGGAVMAKTPALRTAGDGTFLLASERGLGLLRTPGWYAVTLCFQHAQYEYFTKTYTLKDSTNTVSGEPLVLTGDILLIPVSR